jgi:hypothetical protein
MPMTFDGNGTITGLSAGGLPDSSIVTADIANAAITAAKMSGAQNGSAPIYGARAWVNFNGTGTVAIRASGNVSSITDNGTGQYTVNFTTAMSDANYAVSLAGQDTGAGSQNTEAMAIASGGIASGSVGITNIGFLGAFTDLPTVCVSILR